MKAAAEILRDGGVRHPARLVAMIEDTIGRLALDLTSIRVLTEAATGPYVVTPVMAALAGAHVTAFASDSRFGTAAEAERQVRALERLVGREGSTRITRRDVSEAAEADLVTNLGPVRPVDGALIEAMKPGAVISVMCEAWELREDDIDVPSARAKGIRVLGTCESVPGLNVFGDVGPLAALLVAEAQVEVRDARIVVVGGDAFATVISAYLRVAGAVVQVLDRIVSPAQLTDVDAIIVADYHREDVIIGAGGDITGADLRAVAPATTVVQFYGRVAVDELVSAGIPVHPGIPLAPHRMARTLAALGPRPVVWLHAGGLKVGQMALRPLGDAEPWGALLQEVG